MPKVLIITQMGLPVPAVRGGGIETLLEGLIARNELEQKLELTVVAPVDAGARQGAGKYPGTRFLFADTEDKRGDRLLVYVEKIVRRIFGICLPRKRWEWKVWRFARREQFDAVILEGYDPDFAGACQGIAKGKVIYHVHIADPSRERWDRTINCVFAISGYVKRYWLEYSTMREEQVKVIYNCIDPARFQEAASEKEHMELRCALGIDEDDFVLLFVGRICRDKGVKELVEAVRLLNDRKVKLLLLGSSWFKGADLDPYELEVRNLAKDLDGQVICTGYVDNKDLYRYHALADLAVVPSMWEEGAGLITIEAMASGLPLLITQSGGMPEYVDKNCAVTVEKGDGVSRRLAEAVRALKTDAERRRAMAEHGRKRAEQFTYESYYKNYVKALEEFLSGE